jgi:uncharacterized protein GlcG (DUF336 family)
MKKSILFSKCIVSALLLATIVTTHAEANNSPCDALPAHAMLKEALVKARSEKNGGFDLDMWGTVVNRDGIVCAVAFTGKERDNQWPGSRIISAQKANTANAFSLPGLALSTANLFSATQPGGSLFGLQESNPVNTAVAYAGMPALYGKPKDPMVGSKIGGVNVFGGGLALYNSKGKLLGGLGVSGDSSCADHAIAWRTRKTLELDFVPKGVSGDEERPDAIVYDRGDTGNEQSKGGWGHPVCAPAVKDIAKDLPTTKKIQQQ